jgi:hypothetical protein
MCLSSFFQDLYVLPFGQMSYWGPPISTYKLNMLSINLKQVLLLSIFSFILFITIASNRYPFEIEFTDSSKKEDSNSSLPKKEVSFSFMAMFLGLVDGDGYIEIGPQKQYHKITKERSINNKNTISS